jgi:ABC-type bacteriocin/lantibiotic exporter with double-glycine peptidase domain
MNLGIRLSNVVTMIVYNKSMKYAPLADKKFSEAEITNYSQVDAERLVYIGDQVASFFYGPLQISFGLFMMYFVLRFTFLTTIGIILIILVISYFISKVSVRLNEKSLKAKDERMKATEEMLDIIRYIKISAIEKFFFNKVNDKREKEIKVQVGKGLNFVAIASLFWLASPLLVTSAFLTYILLGHEITSEIAFTTMTIVNLFEYPLYSLPTAVSECIQIVTSLKRI